MHLQRMIGFSEAGRLFKVRVQTDACVFEVETTAPDKALTYRLSESGVLRFEAVTPE